MAGLKVTQADAVTNWQTGTRANAAKYTDGINKSADWALNTVQALPAMFAGLQAAMSDGRIEAGINNLGTAQWRARTIAKASNWLTGVTSPAGIQAYTAGVAKLYPMITNALAQIGTLPRGTYEQNKARANAYMDAMHAQKT